jgi:NAD(P)H-dependent FMN reductase
MSEEIPIRARALGIVGSPRRGGNTETLVDEVLAGAQAAGALTEKVILNELDISPCQACNNCWRTGACVQRDDMPMLLEQMARSQVWVLGMPVYWWGPTAQFKAFLDRWYGVQRAMFAGRRVVLAIPLGGGEWYARHTVGMLTDIIPYLGMEHVATVLAPGGVNNRTDVLAAARRAGQKAIGKGV